MRTLRFRITLLALGASASLSATTLIHKDLDALVKQSGGIASGIVTAVNSYRDQSRDVHIQTFVTLSNVQALHGQLGASAPSQFAFRVPGGRVDHELVEIHGSPRFAVGDHVIVFLRADKHTFLPIVGWTQGVFRVVSNPATGGQAVTDHDGNLIYGIQGPNIQKETRARPQAVTVDPRTGGVIVESSKGTGGVEDNSGQEAKSPIAAEPDFRRAMPASEFINAIVQRAASRPAQTVESAESEELLLQEPGAGAQKSTPKTDAPPPAGVNRTPVPPKERKPDQ